MRLLSVLLLSAAIVGGCASGPRPIYTNLDTNSRGVARALVIGRSVSSGPELVVLHNAQINEVVTAIRSIGLNREQEFVLALEPGTWFVHRLGAHGSPIGPRDKAFSFTVTSGEAIYIGSVNPPFAQVTLVDESRSLLPRLQAEVPELRNAKIITRLAS